MKAVLEGVLGWGAIATDPINFPNFLRRAEHEIPGLSAPAPFLWDKSNQTIDAINKVPPDTLVFLTAISCGANVLPYIASKVNREIAGMYAIQPSHWCQSPWMPPVGPNVEELVCIWASCWKTLGLGCHKTQLKYPPILKPGENLYDGVQRVGNHGSTKVTYLYVNDLHPGDQDVVNVQNPILNYIKRRMARI